MTFCKSPIHDVSGLLGSPGTPPPPSTPNVAPESAAPPILSAVPVQSVPPPPLPIPRATALAPPCAFIDVIAACALGRCAANAPELYVVHGCQLRPLLDMSYAALALPCGVCSVFGSIPCTLLICHKP